MNNMEELSDDQVAELRNRSTVPSSASDEINIEVKVDENKEVTTTSNVTRSNESNEEYQIESEIDKFEHKPVDRKMFETFTEVGGLPSKGLFYNTSILGQAPKVDDIILLSTINTENQFSRFSEIFSRRIKGISPLEILVADEVFLALWLRYAAYPNKHFPGLPYTCVKCDSNITLEESRFYFEQMELFVKGVDELFELYKENGGKIPVELGDRTVHILPKRRMHVKRINDFIKANYGIEQSVSDVDREKLNLLANVDCGMPLRESLEWLSNAHPEDYITLKNAVYKYSVSTELPKIDTICASCGEVTPIPGYIFRGSIYLPKN